MYNLISSCLCPLIKMTYLHTLSEIGLTSQGSDPYGVIRKFSTSNPYTLYIWCDLLFQINAKLDNLVRVLLWASVTDVISMQSHFF